MIWESQNRYSGSDSYNLSEVFGERKLQVGFQKGKTVFRSFTHKLRLSNRLSQRECSLTYILNEGISENSDPPREGLERWNVGEMSRLQAAQWFEGDECILILPLIIAGIEWNRNEGERPDILPTWERHEFVTNRPQSRGLEVRERTHLVLTC